MYENLLKKVETISETYADLVDLRIRSAARGELTDATVMSEANDGIRLLAHITATLERVDRLHRGNDANGQV